MKNLIDWTRVNNDTYGNPRFVCHYLTFKPYQNPDEPYKSFEYEEALKMARELGGKKFHNKQYGGGIVFQCYNLDDLSRKILKMTKEVVEYHREPTAIEIKRGYGATHYRSFPREQVTNRKGDLKKWFKTVENGILVTYSR